MNSAIDDKHRSRLRRKLRSGTLREKAFGGEDVGLLAVHVKNAVRFQVKIAGRIRGIWLPQSFAVLDVKPQWRQIRLVHAAVHGELYWSPVEPAWQMIETAVRLTGFVFPEQTKRVLA